MKKIILIMILVFTVSCQNNNENIYSVTENSQILIHTEEENTTKSTEVGKKISQDASYMQCIDSAKYSCGMNFIQSYASINSDEAICREFQDESLQKACIELVITETAKKTLDEERCEALSDKKKILCIQETIMAKGIKNSDPTVCSNYVISEDDSESLENMKDRCVIHIIDQLIPNEKTKGLCGLIINEGLQQDCESRISEIYNAGNL